MATKIGTNNGLLNDFLTKKSTLLFNDGITVPFLNKSVSEPTPIGYVKLQTGGGTIDLPIYDTSDITENQLRIETPTGAGCFWLVATSDSNASGLRIYTGSDTLSIRTI